ncbi:uncharacterized protein LOC121370485 [Gigantopelta aegis]|uniref:uncharacterized protein LOC121370485 n=1 Tax=Gigantopelta aegis TaxID=1735272 RepID=UPI001B88CEC2|nr:uncharacterized protein LOC121370485 [Gigantopelta aegis]
MSDAMAAVTGVGRTFVSNILSNFCFVVLLAFVVAVRQIAGECCNGTLGYATSNPYATMVCSDMKCCNAGETVAAISIDFALGFVFKCMPKSDIRQVCFNVGEEVRTTNNDPDLIPRACCDGAKIDILLNQWHAAMIVKCVAR